MIVSVLNYKNLNRLTPEIITFKGSELDALTHAEQRIKKDNKELFFMLMYESIGINITRKITTHNDKEYLYKVIKDLKANAKICNQVYLFEYSDYNEITDAYKHYTQTDWTSI